MPRLKIDDDDLDVEELDNAEYSSGDYSRYDGEQPPKDTYLLGYVKSLWWTYTKDEDPMLKMLFIADGNEGDTEEYNGLPVWENMALTKGAKFKWGPFFEHFGLTIRLLKTKTVIAEEDDERFGSPITKIGTVFAPGEDSDTARCAIITSRERYNGEWKAHVAEWLDPEEVEEAEEDEEELDDEVEEEEEAEEPPPPPTRTRRAATGKGTAQPATKPAGSSKTATTKASAGKTSATKRTAAKPGPAKTATKRAAGKAAGYDEEPPF